MPRARKLLALPQNFLEEVERLEAPESSLDWEVKRSWTLSSTSLVCGVVEDRACV